MPDPYRSPSVPSMVRGFPFKRNFVLRFMSRKEEYLYAHTAAFPSPFLAATMVDTTTGTTVAAMRSIYHHNYTTSYEVRYIWPMKKRHAFKWLHTFYRYFLLTAQITSQIAFPLLSAVSSPTPYNCQCANFTLEFILAFRVFVLFGCRPWIICCMPTSVSGLSSYAGGILFQLSPDANIQMRGL
ncbi:hypothetical protein EV401DRAFT_1948302 [Pisolithus croceorrhizus]|nr:hypothetical protein EV401DRAFT_1948302 [Pisolithus croceorrhizus]